MKINVRSNINSVLRDMDRIKIEVREKAIRRALKRVGAMSITQAARELSADGYNISASEIKAAMYQQDGAGSSLITTIKIRRKTKSLMEYKPRETKAGVMVRVHGPAKLIKGAFIAQRLNGKSGVFIEDKSAGKIILRRQKQYKRGSRGGWHSLPARKLYGPSVGGAMVNEKIAKAMTTFMAKKFEERLRHEIKNILR